MKKYCALTAAFFAVTFAPTALATSALSRACNMSEVEDFGLLRPALYLFNKIGMPDSYLNIPILPKSEKAKYWVNESFTVDLFDTPLNYLYAENRVYKYGGPTFGGGTQSGFYPYKNYSSGFTSQRYTDQTLKDRLVYAVTNRHLAFFARAGEKLIMDYIPNTSNGSMLVHGVHYVVDGLSKVRSDLPPSSATSCNALGGLKWPI